jgi:hypothetical protein
MDIADRFKSKGLNVRIIDDTDLGLGNVKEDNVELIVDKVSMLKRGFVPKEWAEKYPWKKIKKFFKYLSKNLS